MIDRDVHGLLDGPSCDVHLPAHYREIVHTDVMPRGSTMVIDGWKGPWDILSAFPQ